MQPDVYEREHMPGSGEVLYRHKAALPPALLGVTAGLPLVMGGALSIGLAVAAAPLAGVLGAVFGGLALTAITSALLVVFAAGRIVVSEGELHVQLGPSGPRIPIDDIESFEIAPSGIATWGLGFKKRFDGTSIYNMMGDNARAVRIVRKSDPRPLVIVMRDPDGLAGALRQAKARAGGPKVRLETAEEEPVEIESDQERERRART